MTEELLNKLKNKLQNKSALSKQGESIKSDFFEAISAEKYDDVRQMFIGVLEVLDKYLTNTDSVLKVGKLVQGPTEDGICLVNIDSLDYLYPLSENFPEESLKGLNSGIKLIVDDKAIRNILPNSLETVNNDLDLFQPVFWENIGGIKSQIKTIKGLLYNPKNHKELYELFNKNSNNGILLYGPPGSGKTLIAKAIATDILENINSVNIPKSKAFIYIKGGELLSKWVGETEAKIKNIFEQARKTIKEYDFRPVLFIDEAEAIMSSREGNSSNSHAGIYKTIVPTFLAEMDGFSDINPFIILATNLPENVDKAILRPGRIDLRIPITKPTLEDSLEILNIHLKGLPTDSLNISDVLNYLWSHSKTKNKVTGAVIKGVVDQAVEQAIQRLIDDENSAETFLKQIDFEQALTNF